MFFDLFNNLAITSAVLFIAGRFYQNRPLNISAPLKLRVYAGLGSGIIGILLMVNSINVTGTSVIVDLRHLAVVLPALFGGPVASIIAGLIIGIMRIVLFGVNAASILACTIAVSMGIVVGFISKINYSKKFQYTLMNGLYLIASSIVIYKFVDNEVLLQKILFYYILMSVIAGIFTFHMAEYIKKSNENHRSIFHYKLIAENSTDLISTHELDGTFKYVSPSSKSILGYDPIELAGKNPYLFHHPDEINDIIKSHDTINNKLTDYTVEYRFKHKDGYYVWLETKSKRMKGILSEKEELICFSRNITQRKQMENKLIEANSRLKNLSNIDGLTNIPNRRFFDSTLEKEWKKAIGNQSTLSVIMFDIDHFKLYNDTYGHLQGDDCIKEVAKTVQSIIHQTKDFIARYGGEEFVIILPNTRLDEAILMAETIRKSIKVLGIPHAASETKPVVTISLGVATLRPSHHSNRMQIIINADDALYQAKAEGRNRVRAYVTS
ncbi:MAG TPA: diguanylate cyclase [Pseudoneobacillus sp.]|nr:diguanylate cyclase [Pseudoneobacillus sp.]